MDKIPDIGVAGIHRPMSHAAQLTEARVVMVCAGIEGALPSVVGGLVSCPVIAVPTSIVPYIRFITSSRFGVSRYHDQ